MQSTATFLNRLFVIEKFCYWEILKGVYKWFHSKTWTLTSSSEEMQVRDTLKYRKVLEAIPETHGDIGYLCIDLDLGFYFCD